MMTSDTAARHTTDLRLVSHLFDAHSMGILVLTEENIHDIIATLKLKADELDDALLDSDEAAS